MNIRYLAAILLLALLTACGGGGGDGDVGDVPAAGSSNWNQMVWDQDDWA